VDNSNSSSADRIVLATEENFDEQQYLLVNQDVAAAVARGDLESGYAHFRMWGRIEQRPIRIEYMEYVSQQGLSTPMPSADLIQLVVGHRNLAWFDRSRRETVELIISLLSQAGIDYADFRSIFDYGCGCGRVLAGWEGRLSSETRLFGCDINPVLVDFCQKNIAHADVLRTSYYPPLPYQDDQFDFIYAISVYTHLSLPAMLQWTGEFARILRPGGIVLITSHGSFFAPDLDSLSKDGSSFLAEKGYYIHSHDSPKNNFQGSNSYATFVSPDFLKRLFIGFDLIRMFPGISYRQDFSIFRRS
jgi:SAM-dependent methyltransferase